MDVRNRSVVRTLSVLCGITHLVELTQSKLSNLGFHTISSASTKLVLDFPVGYGLSALQRLENDPEQLITVTWNPCQDYEVMGRVSNGKRYRLTPGPSTPLTRCERLVLHSIAEGCSNKYVAQQLHLEEQTVKNTLRSVYRKLEICNHAQAALYYWGVLQNFGNVLEAIA